MSPAAKGWCCAPTLRSRRSRRWSFFFSSRRRHTRLQGDWSSDVCSSDLVGRPLHGRPSGPIRVGGCYRPRRQPPRGLRPAERRGADPRHRRRPARGPGRSEEHTSELQSPCNLVCRLLLEKKKKRALVAQQLPPPYSMLRCLCFPAPVLPCL